MAEKFTLNSVQFKRAHFLKVCFVQKVQFSSVPWQIGSSGGHDGRFSRDSLPAFLQRANVIRSGMGRVVHSLVLSIQLFLCRPTCTTGTSDQNENYIIKREYFSQFQDTIDALPCHIHLPVCLWIMDPHSRAPKKNTSHGTEVLPQDTTHLIQRPCYQRGSPCQDPAGNRTTRGPPDHCKETQTAVV